MDGCYYHVLLYALPSNGLFTKNLSLREHVYRAVAYQCVDTSQYEDYYILKCDTMYSGRLLSSLLRNLLPLSSGQRSVIYFEDGGSGFLQNLGKHLPSKQDYISKDSSLHSVALYFEGS
jgi:hypothetical protein